MRVRTELGRLAWEAFKAGGYAAYLQSAWWKDLKRRRLRGCCRACGKSLASVLHHVAYDRLGCESERQIIPMCRECHGKLHDYLLIQYPGMKRGETAKYTRQVWGLVFASGKPLPVITTAKRWAGKPAKSLCRWVWNRRAGESKPKKKESQLPRRQATKKRKISKIPLAPPVPPAYTLAREPCNALRRFMAHRAPPIGAQRGTR